MSTGARVLNFTGCQRIERKHVRISISDPKYPKPPEISVRLDLSSYELPADARVFVEAYRQTAWQRFDYGTVARLVPPDDRELVDFGSGDGVRFRVKVVDAADSHHGKALILAQADSIPASEENRERSLLPLIPDPDLKEEPWKLVLPDPGDSDEHPEIRISTHLVQSWRDLARSDEFRSLAIPEIFRRILLNVLRGERPEEEEWNQPRGLWIRLALAYSGGGVVPDDIFGDDNPGHQEEWVDEVIASFCRKIGIARSFRKWWKGDDSSTATGAAS